MKILLVNLCLSLIVFLFSEISAQEYTLSQIDNESGLPSNLTKSIGADSRGLIWIATDGGLIRFNGREFENFQFKFNTRFIKDLRSNGEGGMYVSSDEGIGIVGHKGYNPDFKMILQSSSAFSETELHYPKEIYPDSKGALWISDIGGVSKWENGIFRKYSFNFTYHSNSFFKSFGLGEANGNLYITSWQGYLFYYDSVKDSMILLSLPKMNQGKITHAFYCTGDSLFLGQSDGLYLLRINNLHQIFSSVKLSSVSSVSTVSRDHNGNIWFGTYNDGIYKIGKYGVTDFGKDFIRLRGISVKDFFIDKDNSVWICSDDGIFILQERFFRNVDLSGVTAQKRGAIKHIFSNAAGKVFFYDNEGVFLVNKSAEGYKAKKIFSRPGKSILYAVPSGEEELWISFTDQQLIKTSLRSGANIASQKLPDDHFYSLFTDSRGRLWSYLARNRSVAVIDRNNSIKVFPIPFNDVFYVNEFAETEKGEILVAGNAKNNFVFRFDEKTETFYSVSAQFKHDYKSVQALDIDAKQGKIMLATDRGIMEIDNRLTGITRVGKSTEYVASTILSTEGRGLWIGSEQGIHVFFSNDSIKFDRFSGLQSSSIVRGGILEAADGDIYTANVNGVAVLSSKNLVLRKSITPVILGISYREDEEEISIDEQSEFPIGSGVGFSFSSPLFPSDKVRYRVKLKGGDQMDWVFPKIQGMYYLPNLQAGNYTIYISAKESGKLWSEPLVYSFSITHSWYTSPLAIILGSFLLIGVIVSGINLFVNFRINRLEEGRITLEKKVEERTKALLEAKKEAEKLLNDTIKSKNEVEFVNEQIKKLLGIAAHDLKSPLQSILGLSHLIQEEQEIDPAKEYAQVIADAANKMILQINDLLETAVFDTATAELTREIFDMREIIYEVAENNRTRAEQKHQKILVTAKEELPVNSSRDWLRRALDNLVNNAVKYSPQNKNIALKAWKDRHTIYLSVSDDGPGFNSGDIKNLFVRFRRLSAKPTGGESSTGLGLALVKEMLTALGGEISLSQSSSGGAEFTIRLNLHKESL
ncbi:MAG: Adaptive-response sensory-kinase SasA [Ignavibacteriaceae bacterium]|nr:Adaptive-response sensory-kinase SasA [Ignavibacteriaceae bacterium]